MGVNLFNMKEISNSNHAMLLRCIPTLSKIHTDDLKLYNAIRQLTKFAKNEKSKTTRSNRRHND